MQLSRNSGLLLTSAPPQAWANPGTDAVDVRIMSDVEVQIAGTPGGALTPQRSLDGTNFVACNAYDKDGGAAATITTAGIYTLDGGGFLKLTGTLAPATVTIRAGA